MGITPAYIKHNFLTRRDSKDSQYYVIPNRLLRSFCKLMRFFYSSVFTLALPFIFLKLWLRGRKLPAYRKRWKERLGYFPFIKGQDQKKIIWLHTVSVGEFIAAKPLVSYLLTCENIQVLITTMTPTGSEQVSKTFGDQVFHVYAPYDLPIFIHAFLNRVKPSLYIVMETELWPNTIHICHKRTIPIIVANARLSEKSAAGYARFTSLTNTMMKQLSIVAAQNHADAQRYISLGLPQTACTITGSIKFDLSIDAQTHIQANEIKQKINPDNKNIVWIAASTHQGEDEIILNAFRKVRLHTPYCQLILVPRHPDRFDDVYTLCLGTTLQVMRRSQMNNQRCENIDILVGDSMGELLALLGAADIAFIGGSLVNTGGHNSIEPAAWGLPIISGPSRYNFQSISDLLIDVNALTIVEDDIQLSQKIIELYENSDKRIQAGGAAKTLAENNKGALKKLINTINSRLKLS